MGLTTGKGPVPEGGGHGGGNIVMTKPDIVNRERIWGYKVGDFSIVGDYCDGPFCFNPTGRIEVSVFKMRKVYCCFDCEDWDRLLNG